jgi:hypothetical protein
MCVFKTVFGSTIKRVKLRENKVVIVMSALGLSILGIDPIDTTVDKEHGDRRTMLAVMDTRLPLQDLLSVCDHFLGSGVNLDGINAPSIVILVLNRLPDIVLFVDDRVRVVSKLAVINKTSDRNRHVKMAGGGKHERLENLSIILADIYSETE